MVKIAAFYYAPMETVGHGWKGDYEQIIRIFCNSARRVGISPIHICPNNCKPVTEFYFNCNSSGSQLVFERELAYLQFAEKAEEQFIICDPDQVFLRPVPKLAKDKHFGVCFRRKEGAAFNGPRIFQPGVLKPLEWTINNMRFMTDAYKTWDGDSVAFENAVYKYASLTGTQTVEVLDEKYYQSRPALGANSSAIMYHFKGRNGKNEMLQYAQENGLI